jgi:hypothetical protein
METIKQLALLENGQITMTASFSTLIYRFSSDFGIPDVIVSNKFKEKHRKYFGEGKIKSELDEEVLIKSLKAGFLYWDGEKWVSKPTPNLKSQ